MHRKSWLQAVVRLMIVPAVAVSAYAKDPALPFQKGGFQMRLEKAVGLTPEQRESVTGLLAQQREELKSLHENYTPKFAAVQEQTDSKIRALLNPEQQTKFDTFLAKQKQARKGRSRKAS